MASSHDNPNSTDQPDADLQVMSSPSAARVTPAGVAGEAPGVNGVDPRRRNIHDMDGETVALGPSVEAAQRQTSVTGRFTPRTAGDFLEGPNPSSAVNQGLFEGLARAVQAIPAVVESAVPGARSGTAGQNAGRPSPSNQDAVEYASVRSSMSMDQRAPSATQIPPTPLLTETVVTRMREMEREAPLLYPRPEHSSIVLNQAPSTSSSDIQAEVRRQLGELMALRDEEGRRLRAQVEALAMENSELRSRVVDDVQTRNSVSRHDSFVQGFPGFGWLGRGLGSLMGSGRAQDLRSADVRTTPLEFNPSAPRPTGVGVFPQSVSMGTPVIAPETSFMMDPLGRVMSPLRVRNAEGQVPHLTGQVPQAEGQVPHLTGQVPQAEGQVPHLTGQVPHAEGQVPYLPGPAPQVRGQAPQVRGQVPCLTGQVPQVRGQVPCLTGQVPHLTGQVPHAKGQVPFGASVPLNIVSRVLHAQGQVPGAEGQVPHLAGQVPGAEGQVPHLAGQVPGAEGQVPHLAGQVPGAEGQVPHLAGQVPCAEGQVPHLTGQVPCAEGQVPHLGGQVPEDRGVPNPGVGATPSVQNLDPLNVVLSGMAQLQGIVTEIAASPKSTQKPEVIKPGVQTLPSLPELSADSCLLFADWLHNVRPALADVSDNSEELWSMVTSEATAWYSLYLKLDPLSRLTHRPVPSSELSQVRWQRVSRRMETMILAATPSGVRDEVSSARISGLLPLVCKLFVVYGPGSLTERELGLRNIQDPPAGVGVTDTIELLRRWKRWCSRMSELGGSLPDCALQVKAITKISKTVLSQHPEVSFRVSLSRASLHVDMNPDNDKVMKLHAQILSELEAIHHRGGKDKEGDKDKDKEKAREAASQAKVKGVEATAPGPPSTPKAPRAPKSSPSPKTPNPPKAQASGDATATKIPCTFFVQNNGCKKGSDCKFEHNWNAFSKEEKAQRCRTCGSKHHRAQDCKAGVKEDRQAPPSKAPSRGPPNAKASPEPGTGGDRAGSQQHIKSMLADAARILHQAMPDSPDTSQTTSTPVQAVPISPAVPMSPSNPGTGPTSPVQGTPVTLASLSAQLETLRGLAGNYEVRTVRFSNGSEDPGDVSLSALRMQLDDLRQLVTSREPIVRTFVDSGDHDQRLAKALALLDSGATHAVIPYNNTLGNLEPVPVTLAGDERQQWLRTRGGTLVVPPTKDCKGADPKLQMILPLGSLVETLGCTVEWSRKRGLRLKHPTLGLLKTGLSSSHCPMVQEDQTLKMIAELESKRLDSFEEGIQNLECQIEHLQAPPDPTDELRKYISTGNRRDALKMYRRH